MLIEMGFYPAPTPLPNLITSVIVEHGCYTFCQCPSIIVPQVVWDFYPGRLHGNRDAVTFKRETISFSAKDINEIYQMKDNPDAPGNKIIDDPMKQQMEDALRVLAQLGTKWSVSLKGIRTLESKSLLLEGRLWVYLVKNRLIPTTHDRIYQGIGSWLHTASHATFLST